MTQRSAVGCLRTVRHPSKPSSRAALARAVIPLICAVALWPVIAWAAARFLVVEQELPSADAIVLLSGSATYIERANQAAKLFHAGRAPVVIVTDEKLISGWSNAEQRNPFFYNFQCASCSDREVRPRGSQ